MQLSNEPSSPSWRPTITGSHYAVSCGHYLASIAAEKVLSKGGNAIDAGVTAAMALAVLQPDVVSFAGVAPMLIYLKSENRVISLAGLGHWPEATDISRLSVAGKGSIPDGILRQIVPAAPATHIEALRRFGTLSFEEAAGPALELARDGFAMYPELHDNLEIHKHEIDRYSENASIFRPGGRTPAVGTRLTQATLAKTIGRMIEEERKSTGSRQDKLRAVHDFFYRGEIADEIAAYHDKHGGFLTKSDLESFEVPIEDSIFCDYEGWRVHTCDVWCQGIVLLEALKILEGQDLRSLGHNSSAYLHFLVESLNLAFADREAYVGDPRFVAVPTRDLLSSSYAIHQRARISHQRAFGRMPQGGLDGVVQDSRGNSASTTGHVTPAPDTIYACVVDASGNAVSITPSDTMYDSPMIDGLGFVVSTRGMQGRLEEGHPCLVAPGRRPRLTPTPALAFRDGEFALAWGTPGGDVQCSSMLQVFLNISVFGMSVQQAIEAPRVAPFNFPNSFAPNQYFPGRLCVESRIPPHEITCLENLGHDIQMWPDRSWSAGAVCAIARNFASGMLHAGADPRRAAYAIAW